MRPLSQQRPKALIPTLDIPQLAWNLGSLRLGGIERAVVNYHRGADSIGAKAREAGGALGMHVDISYEPEGPQGTAGALRHAGRLLDEEVLVVNADVASDADLSLLTAAHRASGAAATLLGIPSQSQGDLVAEQGWLVDLIDRREQYRSGYRYGGIAIFNPDVIAHIPSGTSGLFETVLAGLVRDDKGVAVYEWSGYWLDVGTPVAHLQVNLDTLSGRCDERGIPKLLGSKAASRDPAKYVGEGATVDGVALRYCVVGSGARLSPGSTFERCVVWDGAAPPRGDYRDCVITTSGRPLQIPAFDLTR